MPEELTPIYYSLVSLGGSDGQDSFPSGTQIQTNILDARDVASIGQNDFVSPTSIGQSQVWWITYSIGFFTQSGAAVADAGRKLTVTYKPLYTTGVATFFSGEQVVFLPLVTPFSVSGEFRVDADGAQLDFDNNTGFDYEIWWRAWGKAR